MVLIASQHEILITLFAAAGRKKCFKVLMAGAARHQHFKNLSFLLILLLGLSAASAQTDSPPGNQAEYEKEYESRIKRDHLYGVYIPKDLTDAFIQLNRLIDEPSRQKFKSMPEDEAASRLFFSFGRWITHNWGFYGGSRLSHYLRQLGVSHPDDMAQFIIIAYHRNLNRNPLEVKALVERFRAKRLEEIEAKRKEGTIIHEETRKRAKDGER